MLAGHPPTRPFLKWAGGKRQLLPVLRRYYPQDFGAYYEPFLGSGAVFFDLQAAGLLGDRPVVLSDTNRDIIGCYLAIRNHLDRLVMYLRRLAADHAAGGAAHYYDVRDQQFNPWRQRLYTTHPHAMPPRYPTELAAMFIYLNRTGYNGLFRLNRRGGFNVPAGRYANPKICDVETLRKVHDALSRPAVTVRHAPFEHVGDAAQPGDFLYFDPPYAPLSATARFTAYTADGFDDAAQARLQRLLVTLARRRCQVLLSNSSAPSILTLYEDSPDVRSAGLDVVLVPARRAINSHAGRRGPVSESLVMNVPARDPEAPASAAVPGASTPMPTPTPTPAGRRPAAARGRPRQLGVDSSPANGGRLRVLRRTARQA